MSEIAVHHSGNELAVNDEQPFWNDKQIAALRQLGVDRAGNGDLAVFHHVCQRTGLDPFARQIYMIERQGKQTIQTGIDGFRLVARRAVDRSGETLSIGESQWCDREGNWTDVWLKDEPPAAARVTVVRNGQPFPGTALWREYAQFTRDGRVMAQWATRPAGMLAKCAEALALRKAFPQDLSGIYTDDEAGPRHQRRHTVVQGERVTAAEITGSGQPAEPPAYDMNDDQRKKMFACFNDLGITDREKQLDYIERTLGRRPAHRDQLYVDEATRVIDGLVADASAPWPDEEGGAS